MKALSLAALLANLVFFAWSHWLARPSPAQAARTAAAAATVPRLVLASEARNTETPVAGSPGPAAATAPDSVEVAGGSATSITRCATLGPFTDLPDATEAATTLRARGFQPRTRAIEGDVPSGLWVRIEGIATRADAQRTLAVLKASGLDDATLMEPAGPKPAISIGVFTDPARAQRRAAEVIGLGFTPKITDRTRRGTLYWLDNDLKPSDTALNPSLIQNAGAHITRLEVHPCPPAAPSKDKEAGAANG